MEIRNPIRADRKSPNSLDEWVPAEIARQIFKGGAGITKRSLINRVHARNLPDGSYRKSLRGNYFFHLPTLMGFENE